MSETTTMIVDLALQGDTTRKYYVYQCEARLPVMEHTVVVINDTPCFHLYEHALDYAFFLDRQQPTDFGVQLYIFDREFTEDEVRKIVKSTLAREPKVFLNE